MSLEKIFVLINKLINELQVRAKIGIYDSLI